MDIPPPLATAPPPIGRWLAGRPRTAGYAAVTLIYAAAGLAAWGVVAALPARHPLLATLAADVAATVVVFAGSVAVNNASAYDPYWSVAPPVIALAWLAAHGDDGRALRQGLLIALVCLWAVRLTGNWALGWRGPSHEDWRYGQLRERRGRVPWWVVNLGGIHLMPTLVVFLGVLPMWPALTRPGRPVGLLDALAVAVAAGAIALEATADGQLRRFAADPAGRGQIMDRGVWRLCRHPNYTGEIAFWWGVWLFGLAAAPGWWWSVVGPLVMVALFAFVSVPLMDQRSLERRPGYAEHLRRVPALMPRWR